MSLNRSVHHLFSFHDYCTNASFNMVFLCQLYVTFCRGLSDFHLYISVPSLLVIRISFSRIYMLPSLWERVLKNHKIQSLSPCHFCMRTVCELGMLCLRTGGSYELFSSLDLNSVHLILCLTTYFTLLTFSSPQTLRLYSFLLLYQFPSLLFCFSAFHYCQHQILL